MTNRQDSLFAPRSGPKGDAQGERSEGYAA